MVQMMLSVVLFSPWAASLATGPLDLGAWCPHCGKLLTGLPGSLTGPPPHCLFQKNLLNFTRKALSKSSDGELS